jgi:multiple sugar transport system substrate-binding protein
MVGFYKKLLIHQEIGGKGMRRYIKSLCGLFSVLLLLFLLLTAAACSKDSQDEVKRDLYGDGKGITLKLTFSGEEFSKEPMGKILDEFFKETGISTEVLYVPSQGGWAGYFSKIQTMVASGDVPDVIRIAIEGFRIFQEADLIVPFNEFFEAYPNAKEVLEEQHPNLMAPFVIDDKIYGITFDWNNVVTHINTNILKECGLEMPPEDWNLENFLDYAQKMTFTREDGTEVYGYAIPNYYFGASAWFFNNGGSILNEDWTECTLDTPEIIEVVQFWQDSIYKYKVAPQPPFDEGVAFQNDQLGMHFKGRWPLKGYKESEFDAVDVQYIPTMKTNQVIFGSGIFPVLKASKHKEEAFQLAVKLSTKEAQEAILEISHIPAHTQVMDEVLPEATFPKNSIIYRDSADRAKAVESPAEYGDIQAIFDRYLSMVLANESDAETAMKKAAEEIDEILKYSD